VTVSVCRAHRQAQIQVLGRRHQEEEARLAVELPRVGNKLIFYLFLDCRPFKSVLQIATFSSYSSWRLLRISL